METVYQLLFAPSWQTIAMLAVLAVPLLYFAWRGHGRRRLAALIPLALAGGLLITDAVVQTDREQVQGLLEQAADALKAGQPAELEDVLAEDFEIHSRGRRWTSGKAAAIAQAKLVVAVYPIGSWEVTELRIAVESADTATADYTVRLKATAGMPMSGRPTVSSWRIRFSRQGRGWRIVSADLLTLNGRAVDDLPRSLDIRGAL